MNKVVSFGTGNIRIGALTSGGKGYIGLKYEEKARGIGAGEPTIYETKEDLVENEVVLEFGNIESLGVLINELYWVRKEMRDEKSKAPGGNPSPYGDSVENAPPSPYSD